MTLYGTAHGFDGVDLGRKDSFGEEGVNLIMGTLYASNFMTEFDAWTMSAFHALNWV